MAAIAQTIANAIITAIKNTTGHVDVVVDFKNMPTGVNAQARSSAFPVKVYEHRTGQDMAGVL